LIGLAAGLALGGLLQGRSDAFSTGLAEVCGPIGTLWVRALQMLVVPLVITQLVTAVSAGRTPATAGRVVGVFGVLFLVLLALAAAFPVSAAPPLMNLIGIDTDPEWTLNAFIPQSARDSALAVPANRTFAEWLVQLVPTNPFRAAVNGELLQIVTFALLF